MATEYDRELIVAARDNSFVRLYFSPSSLIKGVPDMTGKITVVDRYMLKLKLPVSSGMREFWIQKHNLAGVEVESSSSKRAMESL